MQNVPAPAQNKELQVQIRALDVIKAGLQSGAITLKGSANVNSASSAGVHDAAYLISLLNGLVSGMSKKES